MASASSSGKKYLQRYFFPLGLALAISSSYYFTKKMTKTASGVATKKKAYKWTTPAEETFLSALAEAVNMGLRRKSILLGGKYDLSPRHLTYRRL
jgi:hypothetical protein